MYEDIYIYRHIHAHGRRSDQDWNLVSGGLAAEGSHSDTKREELASPRKPETGRASKVGTPRGLGFRV